MPFILGVSQMGQHPLPPQILPDDADITLVVARGHYGPKFFGFYEGAGLAFPSGEIRLDRDESFHGGLVDLDETTYVGKVNGVASLFLVMNEVGNQISFSL
jgi:hypothetical protein